MKVGIATSIGEQPIKGLLNASVGARMAVAESLTNLVLAPISCLKVKIIYVLIILIFFLCLTAY